MNPAKNCFDTVELVELSTLVQGEVKSSVPTRWERKQAMLNASPAMKKRQSPGGKSPFRPRKDLSNLVGAPAAGQPNKGAKRTKVCGMSTPTYTDRFIASRSALDIDNASYRTNHMDDSSDEEVYSPNTTEYRQMVKATMGVEEGKRVLAFKQKAPAPMRSAMLQDENPLSVLFVTSSKTTHTSAHPTQAPNRMIPSTSSRILDAPGLIDDFYINPLDWSVNNQIAVALGPSVYLWNASSGAIDELMMMPGGDVEGSMDHVSSVKFVQEGGNTLAVGSSDSTVGLWDVEAGKRVRSLKGHSSRISSLDWNHHILTR
jgi:cell division cycle protein 20 (cofactor of APC complex)